MLKTFFPDPAKQTLDKYSPLVNQINSLEPAMQKLSDIEFE